MSHEHPYGKPVNVLRFTETKQVQVDKAELEKMFDHQEVKNRKVVVFSIIGAFRRGKSFFLDYCLRFLYANVSMMIDCHTKSLNVSSFPSIHPSTTQTTHSTTNKIGWEMVRNLSKDSHGSLAPNVTQLELSCGVMSSCTLQR